MDDNFPFDAISCESVDAPLHPDSPSESTVAASEAPTTVTEFSAVCCTSSESPQGTEERGMPHSVVWFSASTLAAEMPTESEKDWFGSCSGFSVFGRSSGTTSSFISPSVSSACCSLCLITESTEGREQSMDIHLMERLMHVNKQIIHIYI